MITVTGELDASTVSALAGRLDEAAAAHPGRLVLDLGGVFADAAAGRALEEACERLAAELPVTIRAAPAPPGTAAGLPGTRPPGLTGTGPGSGLTVSTAAAGGPEEPGAGRLALLSRLQAGRSRAETLHAQSLATCEQARRLAEASERIRRRRGEPVALSRELLAWSPFARLLARAATMPVIEQAKGIIMAQAGCQDEEAFDVLRRASQRMNVPVRELAARIVTRTAERGAPPGRAR